MCVCVNILSYNYVTIFFSILSLLLSPRLKEAGVGVRLVTNESSIPVAHLLRKLQDMEFEVEEKDILSPIPAILNELSKEKLTPHLLVSPEVGYYRCGKVGSRCGWDLFTHTAYEYHDI